MRMPWRRRVSRTDAPTLGFVDTWKRRRVNPPQTQREADVERAEQAGAWAPTAKADLRVPGDVLPADRSGVDPSGVVDESMTTPQRA